PAHFTDSPYALTLTIKDRESGVEGSLTFTGALSGTLSSLSSNLHNRWTSPRTQRLHLGHHIYIVRIGSFLPPGPPDHQFLGSISAHVRVVHNPEPSGLVLAGLGVPVLGLICTGRWGFARRPG